MTTGPPLTKSGTPPPRTAMLLAQPDTMTATPTGATTATHTRMAVCAACWPGCSARSHALADQADSALAASADGMRALKISLAGLAATATAQLAVTLASGSVALLADTIHNFADALTAVPIAIAFLAARRPPNRRYTNGYGRSEDIAGLFVLLAMTASALLACYEAITRLINPRGLHDLSWVALAGIVGFIGNELVADGLASTPPAAARNPSACRRHRTR